MVTAVPFSVCEHRAGDHPRGGRVGDRYDLFLQSLRYDATHFDVFALARNQRTGERWGRLFTQEPDDRQVGRAVEWLLELTGLESSGQILRMPLGQAW